MSGKDSAAFSVHTIDTGGRTDEQKAEITRVGGEIAKLLLAVSSGEVLFDILLGVVASAALNTGGDEAFIGAMVAELMASFPQFKAARDKMRGTLQ